MTDTFRTLCANLTAALLIRQSETADDRYVDLIDRSLDALATAATAESVHPTDGEVPDGPSDEDAIAYWDEVCEGDGEDGILRFARYVRRTNHLETNK